MTPVYLRHKYQANGVFNAATSILAIHNLAHQGTSLANSFPDFKLPQHVYSEMEWIYTEKDGRRTPVRLRSRPFYQAQKVTGLHPLTAKCACPSSKLQVSGSEEGLDQAEDGKTT
jgi:hypothetical protein